MNDCLIDNIVRAVLYEGYILYPYRRSTKNRQRWTFGGIFPRDYGEATRGAEPHIMQTQCLLHANPQTKLSVRIGFLQLIDRQIAAPSAGSFVPVDEIEVAGKRYQTWQEATERSIKVEVARLGEAQSTDFHFSADQSTEQMNSGDGAVAAMITRSQADIAGRVEVSSERVVGDVARLTLRVSNTTPLANAKEMSRDQAQMHAMASTHAVLRVSDGQLISMIDPPASLKDAARRCKHIGAWPVLVGESGATDKMLAAPIILYDYPEIAPESAGDLFDGTEIDEILSLRIMTLTDEEKRSASDLDDRAAAMLRRTVSLARDQLIRMHGVMKTPKSPYESRAPRTIEAVHVADAELRIGDKVKLRPTGHADAFDIILRGKIATIVAIEQDFENRIHLAVTIDDDPGADIGEAGKIGHRFFFKPDEVEPLPANQEASA